MPVHFKVIQFVYHFQSQLEPAEETAHRAFLCDQALCVHDTGHQFFLGFSDVR